MQRMYNVTMWHVRVTIVDVRVALNKVINIQSVATEAQKCVLCTVVLHMRLSIHLGLQATSPIFLSDIS